MNRKERRNADPDIQARRAEFAGGNIIGGTMDMIGPSKGGPGAGGYGMPAVASQPATGTYPTVNPFVIPKSTGINVTSQTFLPNYYVDWNLSTWRAACDQCMKMGWSIGYATLVQWVFESSPFVQSLFRAFDVALGKIPFYFNDLKGNKLEDWTEELCNKPWHIRLREEILHAYFWGFSGINFDPITEQVYKYPMQEIDPINRMLKQGTYTFYDGVNFEDHVNLLFIQPNTSYEAFLGWMQPIARSFIQINLNNNNWVAAGRRLAFPILTIGYPQDNAAISTDPRTGALIDTNPFRIQAENIASNIDPSKAIVFPYTLNEKGEIQKSIEVESEGKTASNRAHSIFSDFNDSQKNEIREMVLGGTLTADVDKSGSRALGEVQERKFDSVVAYNVEFVLAYLNNNFLPKISQFYKNIPQGKFDINRSKQMPIEDIVKMSAVVVQNGKRLTDDFFEANGLTKDFIEDAPMPGEAGNPMPQDEEKSAVMADRSMLRSKKKYW